MCEQKPYIICGMANINKFYWHKSYPAKCEHSLNEHNNNSALHLQAIRAIFGMLCKEQIYRNDKNATEKFLLSESDT